MANAHIKRYSIALATRETQIKTAMSSTTPIGGVAEVRAVTTPNAGEAAEGLGLCARLQVMQTAQPLWRIV